MRLFTTLKQKFCRHIWKLSRFQALVPGMSYECTKCGKCEQFYHSPLGEKK